MIEFERINDRIFTITDDWCDKNTKSKIKKIMSRLLLSDRDIMDWEILVDDTIYPTEEEKETPQGLNSALNYYAKAMNSTLTCKSNEEGCWTQTKDLQGDTYGGAKNISQNGVGLKTADGMNWSFSGTDNPAAYGVQNSTTNSILVWVDTNGEKKT